MSNFFPFIVLVWGDFYYLQLLNPIRILSAKLRLIVVERFGVQVKPNPEDLSGLGTDHLGGKRKIIGHTHIVSTELNNVRRSWLYKQVKQVLLAFLRMCKVIKFDSAVLTSENISENMCNHLLCRSEQTCKTTVKKMQKSNCACGEVASSGSTCIACCRKFALSRRISEKW